MKNQKDLFPENIENQSPKLDKMLSQIEQIFREGLKTEPYERFREWGKVEDFVYRNKADLTFGDIRRLLDFGRVLRDLKGVDRNTIEEGLFSILRHIVSYYRGKRILDLEDKIPVNRNEVEVETIGKKRAVNRLKILLAIEEFTVESYLYKRSRDSFGGKRRAHALEIYMYLSRYFKDARGFEMAAASLKNKGRDELNAAFNFLRDYYRSLKLEPGEEIIDSLYRIVKKTKVRTTASGALSVLVDTGVIDEGIALYEMDEWKEKNYY